MSMRSQKFNQEKFRELVTFAIIKHDLPFQFAEYEGIRGVVNFLCVDSKHISRNTSKADVMKLYGKEK